MITKRLTSVFLFLLFSILGFSQNSNIRLDLLGIGYKPLSAFRVSYEQVIKTHFAFLLGAEQGTYSKIESGTINTGTKQTISTIKGWGIMPQARYYPIIKDKYSPKGFFIGTHYRFRRVEEYYKPLNLYTSASAHNFGVNAGYKYSFNQINLEILVGFGKAWSKWDEPNERDKITGLKEELNDENSSMRLELTIGLMLDYLLKHNN